MTKYMLLALPLALIVAGCGSKGPSTTGGSSAQGQNSGVTSAYAYSRCMRSHGVPNFPDPKVSISPGHSSIAIAVTPAQTGSPKFKSADKTCSKILPAPPSPAQQQAQERAHSQMLLAFARCLRANGLHDFPDPNAQGQLKLPTVIAAGVDVHSRQFLDATKACVGVTHGQITEAQIQAGISGTH